MRQVREYCLSFDGERLDVQRERVLWDGKICGSAGMSSIWPPVRAAVGTNTRISTARGGSRMKIAISIAVAMALLLVAIIATQFRTDRMTGLVVCDDPTNGDRGSFCRMLSERSN